LRRYVTAGLASAATALLAITITGAPAAGKPVPAPAPGIDGDPTSMFRGDDLPHPLGDAQDKLRKEAVAQLLSGRIMPQQRNGSEVVRLANGQWVEWKRKPAKVDPIFTILAEFGNQTLPATGGGAGPVHNQIAEPDRAWDGSPTDDNSTIWRSNFSKDSYQDLLFAKNKESMKDFYLKQSGGRYTVGGDVTDWVTLPFNEARYGSNQISDANGYWNFVKDTVAAWYAKEIAAGKTPEAIKQYLAQFDVWDRYDYDGDGNFNEQDGYIDHFQVIHAGEGEEAGGGAQGEDAIWSHRWAAWQNLVGSAGPSFNKGGGAPIGASDVWVYDYTTEPENGGLGVFAHEYGHDLGLPDLYDTNGGDNGTGFWTLMSAGSWLNHGTQDIGSTPGYMGPWEKLFLGWLDYSTVDYGSGTSFHLLGAAGDANGLLNQAVVVKLPDQTKVTKWNDPYSGQFEWWGTSADDLNVSLTRPLDLSGATEAKLTAKAQWEIEEDFDYLYGEVSVNNGQTWTALPEAHIDVPPEGTAPETGIDGTTAGQWVDLSYDLKPFAGQQVLFRFRYQTDGGVHLAGPFLDDISLVKDGVPTWNDNVEAGNGEWTSDGFTRFGGSTSETKPHFYIAENRQFFGYDDTLRTGPYNFGFNPPKADWVERFSYQPGVLVWYVNYWYDDNNTKDHPGGGLALPVDVRPGPITVPGKGNITNRRTPYDAVFGVRPVPALTLHLGGVPVTVPGRAGVRTFDDTNPNAYWSQDNPWNSVKVAGTGTKIEVLLDVSLLKTVIIKVTSPGSGPS